MRTHLVFNDLHIPYHEPRVLGAIIKVGLQLEPDQIDILGDLVDFSALSLKHTESPRDERVSRVRFEIQQGSQFLVNLRDYFPKSKIHFYEGNHENRLTKYLAKHAKALFGTVNLPDLLRLKGLGIEWHPYGQLVAFGNFHLTHGDIIRSHSAYTARSMLDKYGVSLMCGHSHRGGAYYRTAGRHTWAAWENFCCCRLDQSYVIGCSNWQHGFSVVHNDMRRRFHVRQVPIIGDHFLYDGEEIRMDAECSLLVRGVKRAVI